jgi:hypothetical protein
MNRLLAQIIFIFENIKKFKNKILKKKLLLFWMKWRIFWNIMAYDTNEEWFMIINLWYKCMGNTNKVFIFIFCLRPNFSYWWSPLELHDKIPTLAPWHIRNAEIFKFLLKLNYYYYFNGRTIFWAKENEESFWKVQEYFILFI